MTNQTAALFVEPKVHRHHTPAFTGRIPNLPAAKKFAGALGKHSWNSNRAIYALRCERNQRVSVRSERRETYNALAMAIVANCDYNPDSEYLFEVMCSVEELARLTSQLHTYSNGRKTYDPVRLALNDWEAAKLIVIHREFDHESKQHKAMRIWVKPMFFEMLGFAMSDLRDLLTKFRRWMERRGLRETLKQRYQRHLMRIARSNVADMGNAHSLKQLLKKIKRTVLPGDVVTADEKKSVISELEQALARTIKPADARKEETAYYRAYIQWRSVQPAAVYLPLESAVKRDNPGMTGEAYYRALVERIPRS